MPAPDAIKNTCRAAAASGTGYLNSRAMSYNAEILHEDIDCASRRVITVEHMGYAVFEHPGIASRSGNDLVHLAQVEALLGGKSNCLTRDRDVHPSEKLIDHLEGRAGADFRAKIVHLSRHGLERRKAARAPDARTVSVPSAARAAPPLIGASR